MATAMAHDATAKLLLDDGEFRVRLDPKSSEAEDMATVFLERQGLSDHVERVGSVHLQADQSWLAAVSGARDGFVVVAKVSDRYDAIVALWQHRREAFLGRFAL